MAGNESIHEGDSTPSMTFWLCAIAAYLLIGAIMLLMVAIKNEEFRQEWNEEYNGPEKLGYVAFYLLLWPLLMITPYY